MEKPLAPTSAVLASLVGVKAKPPPPGLLMVIAAVSIVRVVGG
jgi:hypothetical protein